MNRSLTTEEERRLFSCVGESRVLEARRDHAWMRALRFSGCRVGEFSHVSVGATLLALKTRQLFLPKEDRKGGKRDHVVLLTRKLEAALRDLLAVRQEKTGVRAGDEDPKAALVVNRYGWRLGERSYQKRLTYWCGRAGLGVDVSPHWFRHTLAIALMRRSDAQDPRGIVKRALGHATVATTGIYTEPTREEVAAALDSAEGATRVRRRDMRREFDARVGS